jgi:hypothetical protein
LTSVLILSPTSVLSGPPDQRPRYIVPQLAAGQSKENIAIVELRIAPNLDQSVGLTSQKSRERLAILSMSDLKSNSLLVVFLP